MALRRQGLPSDRIEEIRGGGSARDTLWLVIGCRGGVAALAVRCHALGDDAARCPLPLASGRVLRNTNFRPRFFDPAAERTGLAGLTPHELRHTAASLARANIKVVQQMLGHASAAMTLDVYAGLFADNLDEVADRLDQAFTNLNADQVRTKAARSAVTPVVERRRNTAG